MVVRELTAARDTAVRPPSSAEFGWQRWTAALAVMVALASVTTHVWMLVVMPEAPSLHVVVLVMAMSCLWCAACLVRRPRLREWVATAVMGAAMVGAHLMLTGSDTPHHSMSGMAPGRSTSGSAMSVALVLALVEIAVALAVIWRLTSRADPPSMAESASHRYL